MTAVRLQIVTEHANNMAQHLLKHASGENCFSFFLENNSVCAMKLVDDKIDRYYSYKWKILFDNFDR